MPARTAADFLSAPFGYEPDGKKARIAANIRIREHNKKVDLAARALVAEIERTEAVTLEKKYPAAMETAPYPFSMRCPEG